jgi:insecticidal toxin
VKVAFTDLQFSRVLIITSRGETVQVEFDSSSTFPVAISAGSYPEGSAGVDRYLRELNESHHLQGHYVVVENYSVAFPDSTTRFQVVGLAYYEVAKKRMLFTWDAPSELAKNAQLGGVMGDEVYFFTLEHGALWRVDARTGACEAKYNALFNSTRRTLQRVWVEGT